jgi:hypothetical protein
VIATPRTIGARSASLAAALAILLGSGSLALANGRPPTTNGVHFRPGDPRSIYLATTFGLLVSHDGGCTVRWVCEANLGYGGRWDPDYAIAADGAIYATTYTGLRVSRDGGCSFATVTAELPEGAPGRLAGRFIETVELAADGAVWAGTSDTGAPNDLFVSTDGGVTFAARGLASPTTFWKSLETAPSRPERVYASNYQLSGVLLDGGGQAPAPHVLRSDDRGATWSELSLGGLRFGLTPIVLVLAVDPQQPDVAYLVSRGANPPGGDRLYRTADAGATFTEVLVTAEPIHDVVIQGPDGGGAQTVVVVTQHETGVGGSTYRSRDGGRQFARLPNAPRLACLGAAPDGSLYGCAANFSPDYMALTQSLDGAETFRRLWRFSELAGPVSCPAGTAQHDVCDQEQWRGLQAQLSAVGPSCGAPPPPDAGPIEPEPAPARGCCDSGDGRNSMAFAVVLLAACRRRRAKD